MLKQPTNGKTGFDVGPAAFRRLCVETDIGAAGRLKLGPAAFRRLCVETIGQNHEIRFRFPAAFRRLCVETSSIADIIGKPKTSRLQAAVC